MLDKIQSFNSLVDLIENFSENIDREYMKAVESGDVEEQEKMVQYAAKEVVKKDPMKVVKYGHLLDETSFDSAIKNIKKLPKYIFYVGDVEVIRNPNDTDRQRIRREVISEYGRNLYGDPETRFTNDKFGNTWIWKAIDGIHSQIEPFISKKEGVDVDQNYSIPDRVGLIKNAIKRGDYIPKFIQNEFSRYKEFIKQKSSDPITYDDNGNIIPLSKRFNPKSNDIRE